MDNSIIFRPGRLNGNADGLSWIGSGDDAVSQESVIGPWSDSLASMDTSSGGELWDLSLPPLHLTK